MKNLLKALLVVSSVAWAGIASATPVTITLTGDNIVGTGTQICGDNLPTLPCMTFTSGGAHLDNWQIADSFELDLEDGTYDIFVAVANEDVWTYNNPGGFLAEISWGSNTVLSSSDWVIVSPAGGVATEYGANGSWPWTFTVAGISGDAQWIWTADNSGTQAGTDPYAVFRTTIHVPEPATLALLGFGLVGIGFARRRAS